MPRGLHKERERRLTRKGRPHPHDQDISSDSMDERAAGGGMELVQQRVLVSKTVGKREEIHFGA